SFECECRSGRPYPRVRRFMQRDRDDTRPQPRVVRSRFSRIGDNVTKMRKWRSDPVAALGLSLAVAAAACAPSSRDHAAASLDAAARSYVGLVLALGERDADSLDSYHGPAAWQADARSQHATL